MTTGMIINLVLNLLVVVLLALTISYCWVLNKRIKVLQDSKSELAQLLKYFDESTQRASESIIALQTASKKIGENIQHRIDKANFLLDDLSFMIEKGGKLANQVEASMAVSRARSRIISEQQPAATAEVPAPVIVPQVKPVPVMEQPAEKPAPTMKEKTTHSLEAVLERVIGKNGKPIVSAANDAQSAPARRPRSRVEQELLDMLKSGMKS